MGLFNRKPKVEADCTSGVLTCDGKHHTFTAWKDVILTGKIWKNGMAEPVFEYREDAQSRSCVICNYKERRKVDAD
jgi:hypothetical protein